MDNAKDCVNVAALLATLAENVRDGETRLADAKTAANEASRQETSARNFLNAAQREFDEVVAKMRKDAPAGSNWGQRVGEEVV